MCERGLFVPPDPSGGMGLAPRGRHFGDGPHESPEQDLSITAPRAPPGERDVAEGLRRAAGDIEALELVVGEEADGSAVRRPEGTLGVFRTGERLGLLGIERADPELDPMRGIHSAKNEPASVGRERRRRE
jgi:hypothetical protein